ncbi:MAG: LamG domain-containing protein [Lentisphaeria bacterium]
MKKTWILLLVLCGTLTTYAEALVAEPHRADQALWQQHTRMGRDFWYLLKSQWLELPGVKEEPFVQESGILYAKWDMKNWNYSPQRVLRLRELKLYGEKDGQNSVVKLAIDIIPCEADTEVYEGGNLCDGNPDTFCSISGSIATPQVRYRPVAVKLRLHSDEAISAQKLLLSFGDDKNPDIGRVELQVAGQKIDPATVHLEQKYRTLTLTFSEVPVANELTLLCESSPMKIELQDFPEELSQKLLKHPFSSHLMRPVPFGLSPDNFAREACEKLLNKYRDTHIGICFAEWDSQAFFQSWNPHNMYFTDLAAAFGPPPQDRESSAQTLQRFWDWHKSIFFDQIWGLSGAVGFPQYGMEWGGQVAGMELTNHTSTIPHRTLLRYTAGAGRQYDKPWLLYLAYYLGKFSPNSTRVMPDKDSRQWSSGPDAGISPSFSRRTFMTGYFMGMNYLSFEAQPWGQAETQPDGTVTLNPNGKVLKDFFEWTRSPAGKRGEWYTPILLAVDYHHGMMRRSDRIWGYNMELEKGDLMSEHINRAIDYHDGEKAAWDKPPYSHNLHNSPLGDIFDTAFINPPSGQYPQLDRYAVTILTDDCKINPALSRQLEDYVLNGGTLVFNSIHLNSLPKGMMPIRLTGETTEDEGMVIPQVILNKNCSIELKTASGKPFAVKYRFGNGNAIMTLPEYLLGSDREQPIPYISELLEKLQAEVLPFQISGDAQFLISRLSDGHWKVALINNKGVLKQPWERTAKVDPSYASIVKLTLPENVAVQEVFRNATLRRHGTTLEIDLPPGEIRILEIQGLPLQKETNPPLIGEWKLDGTPGETVSASRERSYDMNYAQTASGKKVYEASAANTAVQIEYNPGFPLKFGTISFWAAANLQCELSDRGGYPVAARFFRVTMHNQRWGFTVFDSDSIAGPPAEHDRWTHIAFTWDGQLCRFFVDGVEYSNDGIPLKVFLPIWNNVFEIGTLGRGRRTFGGKIAEVKLFSKALSVKEIKEIMQKEREQF